MPVNRWHLSIELDDLFGDPERPAMERRAEIAERLRASKWTAISTDPSRLRWLIDKFEEADVHDADVWWNGLYDMADTDRVWLDTVGVERLRRERDEKKATG